MLQTNKIYKDSIGQLYKIVQEFSGLFIALYMGKPDKPAPESTIHDAQSYRAFDKTGRIVWPKYISNDMYRLTDQEYLPPVEASYDIVWTTNNQDGLGAMICRVGSKHPDASKEVGRQTVTYKYTPKVGV